MTVQHAVWGGLALLLSVAFTSCGGDGTALAGPDDTGWVFEVGDTAAGDATGDGAPADVGSGPDAPPVDLAAGDGDAVPRADVPWAPDAAPPADTVVPPDAAPPDAADRDVAPPDAGVADPPPLPDGPPAELPGYPDLQGPDTDPIDFGPGDTSLPDSVGPDVPPADVPPADVPPADVPAPDLSPPDLGPPDLGPGDVPAPDLGPPDVAYPDLAGADETGDTAPPNPLCDNIETWAGYYGGTPTCLDELPSEHYNAQFCEFYLNGFGHGYEGHYGIPFRWLEAYLSVAAQDGDLLRVGQWTRYTDLADGTSHERLTLAQEIEPAYWLTGFNYLNTAYQQGDSYEYRVDAFAFFIDVRRPTGTVVRLWQSHWGLNYTWDDAFALPTTTVYIPYGNVEYANAESVIFELRNSCR